MVKVLACRARNCGFESRFPRRILNNLLGLTFCRYDGMADMSGLGSDG